MATVCETVNEPPPLTILGQVEMISCNGVCDGEVKQLNATGGTPPYLYKLNYSAGGTVYPYQSNDFFANLCADTYNIIVKDDAGCISPYPNWTIVEPLDLIVTFVDGADVTCNGDADGFVEVIASGGTTPYDYEWSNNATTAAITGLGPGTYTVTVTDDNNCTETYTYIISQPDPLVLSGTPTNALCEGDENGAIDISVTGGTTPYAYQWSSPTFNTYTENGITHDLTLLGEGQYNLVVTDANFCFDNDSWSITDPPLLDVVVTSVTHVACNTAGDGSISIGVSGGTPPYSYEWERNQTLYTNYVDPEVLTGLTVGDYCVFITDANGCTATVCQTISQPSGLSVSISSTNITCCGIGDGTATVSILGGTPPYSILWSTTATGNSITQLTPGTYTVVVTDANNCSDDASVLITEPPCLSATLAGVDITCFGLNNGSLTLSVLGGTPGYSYNWSVPAGFTGDPTTDPLIPGQYCVTVTDANGCVSDDCVTINEPTVLSGTLTHTDITCCDANDGTLTLSVSGGTTAYSYTWSVPGLFTGDPLTDPLIGGDYCVTVTDLNGCTWSDCETVINPTCVTGVLTPTDVSCYGENDGSLALSYQGGTGGLSIVGWTFNAAPYLGDPLVDALAPGIYCVTITDQNSCTVEKCATIGQPVELLIDAVKQDIYCNGETNGSINVLTANGVAPYTYNWTIDGIGAPGYFGATFIDNLGAGTYCVTVTDATGCSAFDCETIIEPPLLTITGTATDVSCFGDTDGTINISIGGGTVPITVYMGGSVTGLTSWTGLAPDTYNFTVFDVNGCSASLILVVGEPDPIDITGIVTDASCFTEDDGTIDVSVSGGTAPYIYSWSSPTFNTYTEDAAHDLSVLAAGDYVLSITDASGCTASKMFTVYEPLDIDISGIITNILCHGLATGSVDVTIQGGTLPYSVVWEDALAAPVATDPNGQDVSGLVAGVYHIQVTDANLCVATKTFTINQPPDLLLSGTAFNATCSGVSNGTINLNVSGGVPSYSFLWSDNSTSGNRTGLGVGTYTVTVTDGNGCTESDSWTIQQPVPLTLVGTPSDVTCFGFNNGSIDITVGGGTPPYSYNWDGGLNPVNEHVITHDASDLLAGNYFLTVTDFNGCTAVESWTINQPNLIVVNETITHVDCFGNFTGSIVINVAGGSGSYVFDWSDNISYSASTQSIFSRPAGTYYLTVTDAADPNCFYAASYVINQPPPLTLSGTSTDVDCYSSSTGSIDITVGGGTPAYSYVWTTVPSGLSYIENPGTHDLTGLVAGQYTLVVTDANGCTQTDSWTITEPYVFDVTGVVVDVDCYGNFTGSVDITVSGGMTPYSYLWFSPTATPFNEHVVTHDLYSLAAGTFNLTVTDNNGCMASGSWTVNEPLELVVPFANVFVTQMSMFGANDGAITVVPTGGTQAYSYAWSNGGGNTPTITGLGVGIYTVTVTDANNCTTTAQGQIFAIPDLAILIDGEIYCNGLSDGWATASINPSFPGTPPYTYAWSSPGGTTATITGLPGGTYTVTVTDSNGDTDDASITLTEPPPVNVTLNPTNITCDGADDGMITAVPSGGTPPYTYAWSNTGTTATITGLEPDMYTVTVYDVYGCYDIATVQLTEPLLLVIFPQAVNPLCNGDTNGMITLNPSGGTPAYTYFWTGPGVNPTAENQTGLGAGSYAVTVTDANQCTVTASWILVTPPPLVISGVTFGNVVCKNEGNGWITVAAQGGTPGYTYMWSNSQTGPNAIGLVPGTYTVTVTDAAGCTVEVSQLITEPPLLVATAIATHIICHGDNNGTITGSAIGGTPPYTYAWTGPTGALSGFYHTLLPAGTYHLVVTDANQCTATDNVTITEASALSLSVVSTNLLCLNGNEGTIDLTILGGQQPYVILWSNNATTEDLDNLVADTYCVTVTDDYGCTATICATITQPQNPLAALYITGENVDCYGANNGWFEVMGTGGAAPYQYSLDYSPFTAFTFNPMTYYNLTPGFHLLTIGDSNNCEVLYEIEITEPDTLELTFNWTNNLCYGDMNGTIDMTISGGTLFQYLQTCNCDTLCHTIQWSNGATTEDLTGLAAGTYTVTVTDCNGCVVVGEVTITSPPALILTETHGNLNCYGQGTGWIDLLVTGGVGPYTYAWNNGASTQDLYNLSGGWYSVTVTDANNCVATITVLITEPAPFDLNFDTGDIMCTGVNDGWIDLLLLDEACLQYFWSNGATTQDISGLTAGWYWVTVIDCNGCMAIDSACIYAPNNPLEIQYTVNNVLCFGGNTGSIDLSAVGGTMPYWGIYWTGVVPTECCGLDTVVLDSAQVWGLGQTTDAIANLAAGTYYVTLIDAYNCEAYATIIVEQPTCPLSLANYSVTDIDLNTPGEIDIYVCCGTFPYTYYWEYEGSYYSSDEDLYDVPAGAYGVTITDANGCQTSGSFVIGTNNYPAHWTFEIGETSHTIFIPPTAVPTLSIGDYIGVFYDSLGTLSCGGLVKWEGQATTIAAWGDDGVNPLNETGFAPFEVFTWIIWDAATEMEYASNVSYNLTFPHDSLYTVNGISGLTNLIPGTFLDDQILPLSMGWNLISTYISPFNPDIADVFAPVLGNFIIAKDGGGDIYWPAWAVNTINNILIGDGYKVKMSGAASLSISGTQIIPNLTPIYVPVDWSILGYLRTSPAPIDVLLSSISAQVVIVKNEVGQVYWPSMFNLNTIGNMVPGKGYHIKMASGQVFWYPANGNITGGSKSAELSPEKYQSLDNTGADMTLGIPTSAWMIQPQIGDEVAVVNSQGDVVGVGVYNNGPMSITVWGDDEYTEAQDGLGNDEQLFIKLWHSASDVEEVLTVVSWSQGSDIYNENNISVVEKFEGFTAEGYQFELGQNMPNPYAVSTQISFTLPEEAHIQIAVYNVLGEMLVELVNQTMTSGSHTIEFNAESLPAGNYMYKMVTDNYSATKQMNVIK